jgi:ATP-dependent exoDNAse (exonuclease V) beta subunit
MNLFYVGVTRAREDLYISGFRCFGKNTYDTHSYVSIIRKEE